MYETPWGNIMNHFDERLQKIVFKNHPTSLLHNRGHIRPQEDKEEKEY